MRTTEARVTPEELDAIQEARGQVPLMEWRLHSDCGYCLWLADLPATREASDKIRAHALDEHRHEIALEPPVVPVPRG